MLAIEVMEGKSYVHCVFGESTIDANIVRSNIHDTQSCAFAVDSLRLLRAKNHAICCDKISILQGCVGGLVDPVRNVVAIAADACLTVWILGKVVHLVSK
jgi:hypothetical protein